MSSEVLAALAALVACCGFAFWGTLWRHRRRARGQQPQTVSRVTSIVLVSVAGVGVLAALTVIVVLAALQ
jgi:hypothetical protein